MPFVRIIESDAIDRSTYEAIGAAIDIDHRHPLGLLMLLAGEVDGRWQIVNVWEGREYAERFDEEILGPAFRDVTGKPLSVRKITSYTTCHLVTP